MQHRRTGLLLPLATGLLLGGSPSLGAVPWIVLAVAPLFATRRVSGRFPGLEDAAGQRQFLADVALGTVYSALLIPAALVTGANLQRTLPAAAVWWVSLALRALAAAARSSGESSSGGSLGGSDSRCAALRRWAPRIGSGVVLIAALSVSVGAWGRAQWAGPAAALLPPALGTLALSLPRRRRHSVRVVDWTFTAAGILTLVLLLQGG